MRPESCLRSQGRMTGQAPKGFATWMSYRITISPARWNPVFDMAQHPRSFPPVNYASSLFEPTPTVSGLRLAISIDESSTPHMKQFTAGVVILMSNFAVCMPLFANDDFEPNAPQPENLVFFKD